MSRGVLLAIVATGCTSGTSPFAYAWDDRRVLCSVSIDDYLVEPSWPHMEERFAEAAANKWVTFLHAHEPSATLTLATLERVLDMADEHGLDTVTFRDLDQGTPRAGLALAFDDNQPLFWLLARDLLAARQARATFFVSGWAALSAEDRDAIRMLASDGHDLQPHSVDHAHALDYVAEHGVAAYVADEVLPSLEPLAAEGYPGTAYAYPYGERSDELDAAILEHVGYVRATISYCPYDQ